VADPEAPFQPADEQRDDCRVLAESVLGLPADVPGVLLHPGYAPPATVEMLLRIWVRAGQLVHHLGGVRKVVGVPPEFLDGVGEEAEAKNGPGPWPC